MEMGESADKPGSVVDSHSSRCCVTTALKQPTRTQRGPRHWVPIWSCSEWGLPCHALLPGARCALTAPFHPYRPPEVYFKGLRRSTLCCTFRRLAPPRRYLALCPMEPGLSSPNTFSGVLAATVWPTPAASIPAPSICLNARFSLLANEHTKLAYDHPAFAQQ